MTGRPCRTVSRRCVLRGAGVAVALPWLSALDAPRARAQAPTGPTRLFILTHGHGWSMNDSMPDASFNLPPVLSSLDPVKSKVLVLGGIDNRVGGGHNPTQRSNFTGMPSYGSNQYFNNIYASGPSVDEVIARRLANGGAPRRLDLIIHSNENGRLDPVDSSFFWHGDADAVTHIGDPREAYRRVFGDPTDDAGGASQVDLLRVRRKSVLDVVLGHFNSLRQRVSVDDRARLDRHADKIRELELALDSMAEVLDTVSCQDRPVIPELADPEAMYAPISDLMIDIAVLATACGVTDVSTMLAREARYEWLESDLLNREIAASNNRYHLLFHKYSDDGDNGPPRDAVNIVVEWNVSRFARFVRGLEAIPEGDGTALDHTLCLLLPEFGRGGGHHSGKQPAVLAGNFGDIRMGRYIRYADDFDRYGYGNMQTTHQLLVSMLNAFGDMRDRFGDYSEGNIPTGGLTGV